MLSLSTLSSDPSPLPFPTDSNRQQTKPRGALKSLFNFNFKCTSFSSFSTFDERARQSAGQINKIKWQTHYKASGRQRGGVEGGTNGRAKWQRHGNKSATGSTCSSSSSSNNAEAAAQKKEMANNARRSKGTMVAQHTTDCTPLPPLPPALLLLPASCCCCSCCSGAGALLAQLHCSLAVAKCQRQ